ncbi:MAG: AsnC family transcriptional regulator [Candidatus Micrarchaeota archaeon]|nr:AsnC family transcriptional regulator [Candidatus Micrarchaeota archaeon]
MPSEAFTSRFNERYGVMSRRIVRMLSENSRISLTEMAKRLGVSRRTVTIKLRRLEKELGIRYTLELNEPALGFNSPHLIAVKFTRKPDYAVVEEALRSSNVPQLATFVEGSYDMVIYANAKSITEYTNWDRSMRRLLLLPYEAYWDPSEVAYRQLGFFPIRSEAIAASDIPENDRVMLQALNENSRISFGELSKKLNMNYKTAVYNFNRIAKSKYIKRFTIVIEKPEDITFMSFFSKYIPPREFKNAFAKSKAFFTSDDKDPLINRYMLTTALMGVYDLFVIGAFDNYASAYRNCIQLNKKTFRDMKILKLPYGQITKVVVGSLPIRSIDAEKNYGVRVEDVEKDYSESVINKLGRKGQP